MSSTLQLNIVRGNTQVTANLSWSGATPQGTIEYLIFYRIVGQTQIKSVSTNSLSATISNLVNNTQYAFQATAFNGGYINGHAFSETSVVVSIPSTVPDAPMNLDAVVSVNGAVISGEVQLSWEEGAVSSYYPTLNYNIYQSVDDATYSLIGQTTELFYNVQGLDNGTLYYFRISDVNLIGESLKASISATPLGLASVPQNLSVVIDANASVLENSAYQSVDLAWSAPSDDGGSAVLNYTIKYSLDPSFTNNVFSATINGTSGLLLDANLIIPFADQLTSTGWYYFKDCANNALGSGNFTCSATTLMPDTMPMAVVDLAGNNLLENGGHAMGTVTLTWNYVVDSSTPLLGYIVAYMNENDVLETIYVNDATTAPSHTISGLQNGYSYDFSVFAFNMLGTGASSDINVIPSYMPDAPNVAIVHGDELLNLTWDAPDDQGNAITGYNVYVSTDAVNYTLLSDNQQSLAYEHDGLVNGTNYYYRVSAINDNGEGALSEAVNEYPSTIPLPPQSAIAVINSNGGANGEELTLQWDEDATDVSLNGGSMITMFNITDVAGNVINTVNSQINNPTYDSIVGSLTNGQSYVFRIYAVIRDGVSASFLASPSAIPSGLPDAPYFNVINPLHTDGVGQSIAMQWYLNVASGGNNQVPSNEGSVILSYNVYRDGALIHNVVGANNMHYTDCSLINGQEHSYSITCLNANGEGAMSVDQVMRVIGKPDVPNGLACVHGHGQVNVSWNALNHASGGNNVTPSDQGALLQYYLLEMSSDGVNYNAITPVSLNNTKQITGLINGHTYYFKVMVEAFSGQSDFSSVVTCVPSTSPASVRNVHILPSDSELEVSFDAPLNDASGLPSGGLAYTYNIEVTDQNGGVAFSGSNISTTAVLIPNLDNNTLYNIAIYADNGVDTNYNVYNHQAQPIPSPVALSNLAWNSTDPTQISVTFSYPSALYGIEDYLLVAVDQSNLSGSCSLVIPADSQVTIDGEGNYLYRVYLNSADSANPNLQLTDELVCALFARNSYGISPVSNFILINEN